MPTFNIEDFGAVGDGKTNNAVAIQKTIDAASAAGGGTVLVPSGRTFIAGGIAMKSNVELHVERGSVLMASPNADDFPTFDMYMTGKNEGRIFIGGTDAHNIAFSGGGAIDAQDKKYMVKEHQYEWEGQLFRPSMFILQGCKHVTFRDITLRNAAFWCLHLTGCEDVAINGIRVLNDLKVPNCDGIDIDHCRNVRISDCHVEAGDDCICLKCTDEFPQYGPCENVTVTGCTLISTSAAIKIGTESVNNFRNLVFDACVIDSSSRGLTIQLRDGGNVENVIFSNMTIKTRMFNGNWWGAGEPVYITALPRHDDKGVGRIKNIKITNLIANGENGVFIAGSAGSIIENVTLDNIRLEIEKTSRWPGGKWDLRPCAKSTKPAGGGEVIKPGVFSHKTAGFYAEYARNLTIRNCELVWGDDKQDYFGPAVETHNAEGLRLLDFVGQAAFPQRDKDIVSD